MSIDRCRSALFEMEADLYDVQRFGELLHHMATSDDSIKPDVLSVLAEPLSSLGERLRERFVEACRAAGFRQ